MNNLTRARHQYFDVLRHTKSDAVRAMALRNIALITKLIRDPHWLK